MGRAADLARVVDAVRRCRVVSLCGPGGVGKTRLARHVAAAVADRYDDGVLFVEFGEGGAADVEPLLAAALRLSDGRAEWSGSVADGIVEVLSVRNQLVVLDNCEHVCDEVATLVEAIIAAAPGVDLLLTSREPVRVDGEQVLPVAPLEPGAAARLLVDRMQAGDPAAAPDPEDELVAEVCRRLDHLPLALELAAARALPLGLPGLLDALETSEEPLGVLRGGVGPRRRGTAPCATSWRGPTDSSTRSGGRCSTGCRCSRDPWSTAPCSRSAATPMYCPTSSTAPSSSGTRGSPRGSGCSRRCAPSVVPASPATRPRPVCGSATRRGRRGWPTR